MSDFGDAPATLIGEDSRDRRTPKGTEDGGSGGAKEPGGYGPVDISNWNLYGRGAAERPLVCEQKALTSLLSDWQMSKDNRAVVTLAGDVHIGGFTDLWHTTVQHPNVVVPLYQMTASAIGNVPEKDLGPVKGNILRGVAHADENLFDYKVKHHGWVFGPNYGMVDVQVGTGGRPDITLTLIRQVGDPVVHHLALGDSQTNVKDPN